MADSTESNLDKVLSLGDSLAKLSATALAQAVGLYMAASTAIRTVASGIATAATQATINAANAKYHAVPLSPAVLADMVVRDIYSESDAAGQALYSGIDNDNFKLMVADTGESYGILDALRLYNRGTLMSALVQGPNYATGTPLYVAGNNLAGEYGISEYELKTVIYYSRVRDEFIPDLLKLARNTLSPADAVELAVKQIVPTDVAQSLFEAAGGVGEQFQALVDAAGDAAGLEKAVSLYAHGVIDEGQLKQILGLSRVNPRFYYLYLPDAKGTVPANSRYLGAYEVGEALTNGTIDQQTALTWLLEEGYPEDQAAAFATSKAAGTIAKPKEETAAQVLKEYGAQLLTEQDATTALTSLGYTQAAVPFLLQYATSSQIITARNNAVNRVKAAYLVGDIDANTVKTDLAVLNLPQAAVTAMLADWAVELATPHAHLSAAEVGKLAKEGYLSADQAQAKWMAMGYSGTDAALLLLIYPPANAVPPGTGTPAVTSG